MAAEFVTPDAINFMATPGARLDLPRADARALRRARPRADGGQERVAATRRRSRSRSRRARASRPGISAADRAHTIQHRGRPGQGPRRHRPARPRPPAEGQAPAACSSAPGHTEASVDLARLAGLHPGRRDLRDQNEDGSMARVPDLAAYCYKHGLKMITIADLIAYRRRHDKLVERVVVDRAADRRSASSRPSATARWSTTSTTSRWSRATSPAREDVLVRVHSECLTGDVFHSLRCDCGEQLESALAMIEARGRGRAALPRPGGPRHRPAQQAARLQAPGGGPRHRRRQPQARAARRPARLRHRRADPRRPRADARSGSSPTTRRRSAASRATACRSASRSRSSTRPTRTTRPTCAPRPSGWATRCTTRA